MNTTSEEVEQPHSENINAPTLFLILIPVCACIVCCCCVICLVRFCSCSHYFSSCPKPIRQCCIYEEDEEDEESAQQTGEDSEGDDLAKLQSRGAWIVEVPQLEHYSIHDSSAAATTVENKIRALYT